jgi:hypothetical protein
MGFVIAIHSDRTGRIHMKIKTKVQGGRLPIDDIPPRGCG